MTEIMKKKTIKDAIIISNEFRKNIFEISSKKKIIVKNEKINSLLNTNLLPNRLKCITLGWYAFHNILYSIINNK